MEFNKATWIKNSNSHSEETIAIISQMTPVVALLSRLFEAQCRSE